jgi:hypothetical protein
MDKYRYYVSSFTTRERHETRVRRQIRESQIEKEGNLSASF